MKDLYIDSYGEMNFELAENNKAIRSSLGVFLSIRSSNGYDTGELEFDDFQGLDFDLLLDSDVSNTDKTIYIMNKVKKYYNDIEDLRNFEFEENKEKRVLKISFEYKTIYSGDYEKMGVNANV